MLVHLLPLESQQPLYLLCYAAGMVTVDTGHKQDSVVYSLWLCNHLPKEHHQPVDHSRYHSHLILLTPVHHLFHHHCHHPSLLLSTTPGSKLTFLHSPPIVHPPDLLNGLHLFFCFLGHISLSLVLCDRLTWPLASVISINGNRNKQKHPLTE